MKTLKRSLAGCALLLLTSSTAFAQDSFHLSVESGDGYGYYGIAGALGSVIIQSSGLHTGYGHAPHIYAPPRHWRHDRHHRPHFRHNHRHGHHRHGPGPVYGWIQPPPHRGHHGHAPGFDHRGRHDHRRHWNRDHHDGGHRHGGHGGHDRHGRH